MAGERPTVSNPENSLSINEATARRYFEDYYEGSDANIDSSARMLIPVIIAPLLQEAIRDPQTGASKMAAVSKILATSGTALAEYKIPKEEQEVARHYIVELIDSSPQASETSLQMLLRVREKAMELAAQKGIGVSDVYDDDLLYADVVRASYTPEEYATTVYGQIQVVAHVLPPILKRYLKDQNPEYSAAKINRESRNAKQRFISENAASFGIIITKYWGESALDTLPEELRAVFKREETAL